MLVTVDYKKIQAKLNAHSPDNPYTESESIEAFHNMVGFVRLLIEAEKEICSRKNKSSKQAPETK